MMASLTTAADEEKPEVANTAASTTAASATTTTTPIVNEDHDRRQLKTEGFYDPLPYRRSALGATLTQQQQQPQQQQQQQQPHQGGEYVSRAQGETALTRQQLLEDVPNNLYYDSFPKHHQFQSTRPQPRYQVAPVDNRRTPWQSHLELPPPCNPPHKNTLIDNSVNNNNDGRVMIEPAPVWLNTDTGIHGRTNRDITTRESQGRSSSDSNDHPISMADDDSNPIPNPIQPRFHPVQEPLPPFEKEKQKHYELGRSSVVHVPKHQCPIATTTRTTGHNRNHERRGMVDSFQGRPFYPPLQQLVLPQLPPPPHPNPNSFFHMAPEAQFHLQEQPVPAIQRNPEKDPPLISSPQMMPPRGTTPIPASFDDDHQDDPLFQQRRNDSNNNNNDNTNNRSMPQHGANERTRCLHLHDDSTISPGRSSTKSRKRPWHGRSFPRAGLADSPNQPNNSNVGIDFSPTRKPSLKNSAAAVDQNNGSCNSYMGRVNKMLEDAQNEGFDHIVSWQIHGRAFKIHKPEEFARVVLPSYFDTERIAHFQRWLRAWGFVRPREGADRGAFYHRYFVRGVVVSLVSRLSRDEMFESMKGWVGPVPNICSGTHGSEGSSMNNNNINDENDEDDDDDDEASVESKGHCKIESADDDINGEDKRNDGEMRSSHGSDDDGNDDDTLSVSLHVNPKRLRGTLLEKVRYMLLEAVEKEFTEIVSWLPGGKAFKVHDINAFQKDVCGNYFRTNRLRSFSDSLRTWGFCRLSDANGVEKNAYYHRLFQEGKSNMCRDYSRAQMLAAMKDFREEQKRQKEISWSLFPRHREEQQQTDGRNHEILISDVAKPGELPHVDALARGDDLSETDNIDDGGACPPDPLAIDATAIPHGIIPQPQDDYLIPYLDLPNANSTNADGNGGNSSGSNINNSDVEMNSSMRPYVIDTTCYQILPPGTMVTTAADFPVNASKEDPKPQTELQTTTTALEKTNQKKYQGARFSNDRYRETGVSYVVRIYMMLEDVEKIGAQHIASWRSHGRAFKIHDEKAFESVLLPRYFAATSLASIHRWLNKWGFLRVRDGKDRRCWYHRLFVRGLADLIKGFTQRQMFSSMEEWRAPGKQPDFYCSGKGDELSEVSFLENTNKKKQKTDKVDESSGSMRGIDQNNNDARPEKPSATIGGGKEALPPSHLLQPEKDPKTLRGTLVEKLREMLDVVKKEGKANVVSWLPHGKAFKIHQPKVFKASILHRFFGVSKYRYFGDSLRSWGFVIFKNGKDKNAFYHKYFLQNEPRLSLHLSKHQLKVSMKDWPKMGAAPDFYNDDDDNAKEEEPNDQRDGNSCSRPKLNLDSGPISQMVLGLSHY